MDGTLETTYTLIYSFLTKRSHIQAAQAVKKAAKNIISIDGIALEGPQLDTIVDEWRQSHAKADVAIASLDSGSESSSSSSSDSSSGSSPSTKRKDSLKTKNSSSSNSSDSSSSNSSSSSSPSTKRKAFLKTKNSSSSSNSDSSSSESSSSDSNSTTKKKLAKGAKPPKVKTVAKVMKASSSSSDSSSSDSESSSSASSRSESDGSQSDDESSDADSTVLKEKRAKAKINRKRKFERDSSRTLTSGNNSDATDEKLLVRKEAEEGGTLADKEMKQKQKQTKQSADSAPSSVDDSDSDSSSTSSDASTSTSSSSSSEAGSEASKPTKEIAKDQVLKKRKGRDDSSDSDSKIDEDLSVNAKPPTGSKKDSSEVQVIKKLRTSTNGAAVATATTKTSRMEENGSKFTGNGNGNEKNGRKSNTPFQRFDPAKIPAHVIKDNRYEAKAGPSNDYGKRAHEDLIVTRGTGFRKEKNKKKRGSYKGGEITLESHSFKFS